jgi:hypothetical protein
MSPRSWLNLQKFHRLRPRKSLRRSSQRRLADLRSYLHHLYLWLLWSYQEWRAALVPQPMDFFWFPHNINDRWSVDICSFDACIFHWCHQTRREFLEIPQVFFQLLKESVYLFLNRDYPVLQWLLLLVLIHWGYLKIDLGIFPKNLLAMCKSARKAEMRASDCAQTKFSSHAASLTRSCCYGTLILHWLFLSTIVLRLSNSR